MSIIKFLRSDSQFDEFKTINKYNPTMITFLYNLIRNKSRREFIYEKVYEKKKVLIKIKINEYIITLIIHSILNKLG